MVKYPVVNIGDLRRIVNDLLDHVESVNGPELRLDQDYYWDLGSEVMYDVTKQVANVDLVGSLGDSWEFLLNMQRDDIKQNGPSLMLIHAAPLLRYIGEKVGQ
ncbi:hypothetical protein SAMN05216570_0977 [Dyella sp. OK004]|uniref:hypothetical protein n=1 Tax=Dyella sp. OK004 TaxID=1855292 RepID=UPI0008E0B163|nr:hypothetical protein [Dyella sp. OK004]SFR94379.1 hypothetical protein SAMN05216570_0977 [Dyella sp. OK004]